MAETDLHPADVIDQVLCDWEPGHFTEPRDLSNAARMAIGLWPPFEIDISLDHLAADLIENDQRTGEE